MSSEDEKSRGLLVGHHPPPPPPPEQPQYGTFQGVPAYPPPRAPAMGFPQPMPPPGASDPPPGYQTVPGVPVAEGQLPREHHRRLPCCGLGFGWCLFIIGFFLGGIPWYIAAILMICTRRTMDLREKPGYILCTIAAILETIAIIFGVTKGFDH